MAGRRAGRLSEVLADSGLTAGDFVRWVRQVLDFADQIAEAAGPGPLRTAAREVVRSMRRGVVDFVPDDQPSDSSPTQPNFRIAGVSRLWRPVKAVGAGFGWQFPKPVSSLVRAGLDPIPTRHVSCDTPRKRRKF